MKRLAWLVICVACTTKPPSGGSGGGGGGGGEVKNEELTLEQATAGLTGGDKLMAEIQTDLGNIKCELFPDKAPKTVASFIGLARGLRAWQDPKTKAWTKSPFFDGLTFHRVIPNFMIQGGDPLSRDPDHPEIGSSGPGYTLDDEISNLRFDVPGRLAMANKGPRTHTGGSQFFVTEVPYPSLDGGYVVFGQCDNLDVVQKIARLPKKGGDQPAEPVRMKVKIFRG